MKCVWVLTFWSPNHVHKFSMLWHSSVIWGWSFFKSTIVILALKFFETLTAFGAGGSSCWTATTRGNIISVYHYLSVRHWSCWNDQESSVWVISSSSLLFTQVIQSLCHCHNPLRLFKPLSLFLSRSCTFTLFLVVTIFYVQSSRTWKTWEYRDFKFVISRPGKTWETSKTKSLKLL